MPTYEVTAPNGKRYRVTPPPGSNPTQDEVLSQVQAQFGDKVEPEQESSASRGASIFLTEGNRFLADLAAAPFEAAAGFNEMTGINAAYEALTGRKASREPLLKHQEARSFMDRTFGKTELDPNSQAERLLGAAGRGAMGTVALSPIMAAAVPGSVSGVGLTTASGAAGGAGAQYGAEESARLSDSDPVLTALGGVAGGLIGGLAPGAVRSAPAVAKEGVRRLFRGDDAGRVKVADAISDAATAGTSPTVGQSGASGFSRYFEGILKNAPGSIGRLKTAYEDQAQAVGDRVRAMANQLAKNADEVSAGQSGLRGIRAFTANFRKTADTLYKDLDNKIKPDSPVAVGETLRSLDEITTPVQGAKNLSETIASSKIGKIAEALRGDIATNPQVQAPTLTPGIGAQGSVGALPYRALKELRSFVGRQLGSSELVSELPRAELKKLYAAITADMRRAAHTNGADAVRAFGRANTYYEAGLKRIDDHLERLSRLGAEPEKLFEALWRGRGGETFVQQVRRSLPADDWKAIAATAVRRLGDARNSAQNAAGDVFSPETFLTRWNELSPSAKQAFFGGGKLGTLRQDLDAIARTAERIREQAKVLHNSSGTTPVATNVGAAAAAGTAVATGNLGIAGTIASGALIANASARLMTNPRFVAWLAQTTTLPPTAVPSRLGQLAGIAAQEPDIREDVAEYLNGISPSRAQTKRRPEAR